MTSLEQEIVTMYEEMSFGIEDISKEIGIDCTSVKAALACYSERYAELNKSALAVITSPGPLDKPTSEFLTKADSKEMLQIVKSIAIHGEEDGCRLKAAIYIHEEACGRNKDRVDNKKNVPANVFNIIDFNERLLKARKAKQLSINGAIDVTPARSVPQVLQPA